MGVKDLIEKVKNVFFNLSPSTLKTVTISLGAVVVAVTSIILIIKILGTSDNKPKPIISNYKVKDFRYTPDSSSLKVPDLYMQSPAFNWKSYRTTPDKWDLEEIKRFRKDPTNVIIEIYSDESKEYIEKMLEGVR